MSLMIRDKNKLINFFLEVTNNDNKVISYINELTKVYPNILEYMLLDKTPDLSEVKWVKSKRYKMLKEKVLANVDILSLNSRLNDAFPFKILSLLKKHYSEKYENKDIDSIIVKCIKKSPYDAFCRINGIGFIKADKILLNAYSESPDLWDFDITTSKYRCTSFIIYYLINCLNGSTVTTKSKILQDMKYKFGLHDLANNFENGLIDNRIHVDNDNVMLTTTYLEENHISTFIKKAQTVSDHWNIDVNNYSHISDFKLTEEQLKTLELVNNNQFVLLNGYAGTGKSSSIKALINMLEDNQKTYVLLAPTAKAAKQLSLYTDRPASTIHYLLCHDVPEFDNHINDDNEFDTISHINNYMNFEMTGLNYDVIIVDESSMLSVQLCNILFKYINPENTKVLMIGDSYQLPSIQNGNLYQDLLSIDDIPKIKLNEIFRYKENGLVNVATNIRYGQKYLTGEDVQNIGNSYTFYRFTDTSKMLNSAMNKYLDLLNEGNDIEDIAILTAKNIGNSGTYLVNSCIQSVINPINEFDSYIKINIDKNVIKFKENDVVMNIKNNYNAHPLDGDEEEKVLLANGQTGIVKSINEFDNSMIVRIDGRDYNFEYGDICNLRLAYCFTVHKAQGCQFKHVIYLTTADDSFMTSSNLMYVAITRAQVDCYHYGDPNVVNRKINERENLKRNTSLISQYYS